MRIKHKLNVVLEDLTVKCIFDFFIHAYNDLIDVTRKQQIWILI